MSQYREDIVKRISSLKFSRDRHQLTDHNNACVTGMISVSDSGATAGAVAGRESQVIPANNPHTLRMRCE